MGRIFLLQLPSDAYVVHYDGRSWQAIRNDSLWHWVGSGTLSAIHGISDTCLVAVGGNRDDFNGTTTYQGFALLWNGKHWQNLQMNLPQPLISVWMVSRTDIYAGSYFGALLHYDGRSWQELSSPTTMEIQQIVGLPGGEIYALASKHDNSLAGSMILRLDGTAHPAKNSSSQAGVFLASGVTRRPPT